MEFFFARGGEGPHRSSSTNEDTEPFLVVCFYFEWTHKLFCKLDNARRSSHNDISTNLHDLMSKTKGKRIAGHCHHDITGSLDGPCHEVKPKGNITNTTEQAHLQVQTRATRQACAMKSQEVTTQQLIFHDSRKLFLEEIFSF